jgi:hypothetical protein
MLSKLLLQRLQFLRVNGYCATCLLGDHGLHACSELIHALIVTPRLRLQEVTAAAAAAAASMYTQRYILGSDLL